MPCFTGLGEKSGKRLGLPEVLSMGLTYGGSSKEEESKGLGLS